MSEKIRSLVPGEALVPGRPWLRKVGGQVVRYVRNLHNAPVMKLASNLDQGTGTRQQDAILRRIGEQLQGELQLLEDCGVSVVAHETTIDWVPTFDRRGKPEGFARGLVIYADYVDGEPADKFQPILPEEEVDFELQRGQVTTALERYLEQKTGDSDLLLWDVNLWDQYMIGTTAKDGFPGIRLVDLDPRLAYASPAKVDLLHSRVQAMKQTIFLPPQA